MVLALVAGCQSGSGPSTQDSGGVGDGGGKAEPLDCTALPGTAEELAQSPRANPNVELLALRLSTGVTADPVIYDRLAADLAMMRILEPRTADIGYRPEHDGKHLLIGASPETLEAMADGSYDGWNCLNEHYGFESFEVHAGFGRLALKGLYDLDRLAALYAQLPDVSSAEPDSRIGDGPSIYVTREPDEWHYVLDLASGDCLAGCTNRVLFYFVTEAGGAVRYLDRWGDPAYEPEPAWVEKYWRAAETRPAAHADDA
jgi:hypothetical protein